MKKKRFSVEPAARTSGQHGPTLHPHTPEEIALVEGAEGNGRVTPCAPCLPTNTSGFAKTARMECRAPPISIVNSMQ